MNGTLEQFDGISAFTFPKCRHGQSQDFELSPGSSSFVVTFVSSIPLPVAFSAFTFAVPTFPIATFPIAFSTFSFPVAALPVTTLPVAFTTLSFPVTTFPVTFATLAPGAEGPELFEGHIAVAVAVHLFESRGDPLGQTLLSPSCGGLPIFLAFASAFALAGLTFTTFPPFAFTGLILPTLSILACFRSRSLLRRPAHRNAWQQRRQHKQ